jgi:protein KRI1
MAELWDDDVDAGPKPQLGVNRDYAHRFEDRKRKQELDRLRQRYGDGAIGSEDDGDDSETGIDEDEDGEQLTREVDVQIFRTIDAIRSKDPVIRDPRRRFFSEQPTGPEKPATRETKRKAAGGDGTKGLTMREYMLSGAHSDSDDDCERAGERGAKARKPLVPPVDKDHADDAEEQEQEQVPYVEEQRRLKRAFLSAFDDVHDNGEDGEGDALLAPRPKKAEEKAQEEEDYAAWLKAQLAKDKSAPVTERITLRRYLDEPDANLTSDERFLRDYVSKQLWKSPADGLGAGPGDGDDDDGGDGAGPRGAEHAPALHPPGVNESDADDDFSDREAEFERKMNFRFEDAGSARVAPTPRRVADSVRRNPKKEARRAAEEARKARKAEALAAKKAELARLKALKREEILSRVDAIRRVSGGADAAKFDADADFDPDTWDKQMASMFGDDYYAGAEDDQAFSRMIRAAEEDGDHAADGLQADDGGHDEGEGAVARATPASGSFEAKVAGMADKIERAGGDRPDVKAMLDEYYGLEYADLIAGEIPTRFRYREVEPRSFGLKDEELLLEDDKTLNR